MKKTLIIHPFLFALFPVLFIFSHNLAEITHREIYLPIAASIIFAGLLWLILIFFVKDSQKAGLLTTIFLILFFSYGHFYNTINTALGDKAKVLRHQDLLVFFIALYTLAVCLLIRRHKNWHNFTHTFNFIAMVLVSMQFYRIVFITDAWKHKAAQEITAEKEYSRKPTIQPNIYYIILDGYARQDILQKLYVLDNTEFYRYLMQKNFYIAHKSIANYSQTVFSLASALNLDYLDGLTSAISKESSDSFPMHQIFKQNRFFKFLKEHGYNIVVYASGYHLTELSDNVDTYVNLGQGANHVLSQLWNTTPLFLFFNPPLNATQQDLHREKILSTFEYLQHSQELKAPFFIFAHILCPHPPFVFGRNGEGINKNITFSFSDGSHLIKKDGLTRQQYKKQYINQLVFMNSKIKKTLNTILSHSTLPTIIILQSDHGPGSMLDWDNLENTNLKEKMSILNAYYFFDGAYQDLYAGISPVNSFRILFNRYFGTNYNLLPDKAHFAIQRYPYKFIDVTGRVNSD